MHAGAAELIIECVGIGVGVGGQLHRYLLPVDVVGSHHGHKVGRVQFRHAPPGAVNHKICLHGLVGEGRAPQLAGAVGIHLVVPFGGGGHVAVVDHGGGRIVDSLQHAGSGHVSRRGAGAGLVGLVIFHLAGGVGGFAIDKHWRAVVVELILVDERHQLVLRRVVGAQIVFGKALLELRRQALNLEEHFVLNRLIEFRFGRGRVFAARQTIGVDVGPAHGLAVRVGPEVQHRAEGVLPIPAVVFGIVVEQDTVGIEHAAVTVVDFLLRDD